MPNRKRARDRTEQPFSKREHYIVCSDPVRCQGTSLTRGVNGLSTAEMAYWSGNLVRDLLEALTDNPARVSERTELETESPESLKGAWRERSHKDYVNTG